MKTASPPRPPVGASPPVAGQALPTHPDTSPTPNPATPRTLSPCSLACEDAIDLSYAGSPDIDTSPHRQDATPTGQTANHSNKRAQGELRCVDEDCSDPAKTSRSIHEEVVPKPVSYKEALLRPRTFKPRFSASSRKGHDDWFTEKRKQKKRPASVWSRLQNPSRIQERLGPQVPCRSWLELLHTKAGNKCFNCLSAGHRISECRDPPRCILCLRFGHKARSCPTPAVPAAAPTAAATVAAHSATTTAAAPLPMQPPSPPPSSLKLRRMATSWPTWCRGALN